MPDHDFAGLEAALARRRDPGAHIDPPRATPGDFKRYVTVPLVAQSRPGKTRYRHHTRGTRPYLTSPLHSPPSEDGCGSIRGVDRDDHLHRHNRAALTAIATVTR